MKATSYIPHRWLSLDAAALAADAHDRLGSSAGPSGAEVATAERLRAALHACDREIAVDAALELARRILPGRADTAALAVPAPVRDYLEIGALLRAVGIATAANAGEMASDWLGASFTEHEVLQWLASRVTRPTVAFMLRDGGMTPLDAATPILAPGGGIASIGEQICDGRIDLDSAIMMIRERRDNAAAFKSRYKNQVPDGQVNRLGRAGARK